MGRVAPAPDSGLHIGLGVLFWSFERWASDLATWHLPPSPSIDTTTPYGR